jgi:hypothetical protein
MRATEAERARRPQPVPGKRAHRTSDLVVSVAPTAGRAQERRGRAPLSPPVLPTAAPTTSTTIDAIRPRAAEAPPDKDPPPPSTPSDEEQRREAEAQLAAADIEFVASTHNVQVRQCYERAFKEVPQGGPGGRVELSFLLNQDGRAMDIRTVANTTESEPLARCLEQRVADWRFPRPVGGAKTFQFPFVFLASPGPRK